MKQLSGYSKGNWFRNDRLTQKENPIHNPAITEELDRLWRAAGRPSSRYLAEAARCSHSTIAEAIAGRRLPALRTLLSIVEALEGDRQFFVDLYDKSRAAAVDIPAAPTSPTSRELLTGILNELRAIHSLLAVQQR